MPSGVRFCLGRSTFCIFTSRVWEEACRKYLRLCLMWLRSSFLYLPASVKRRSTSLRQVWDFRTSGKNAKKVLQIHLYGSIIKLSLIHILKVGIIYIGDENEGYSAAHMAGIDEMVENLGLEEVLFQRTQKHFPQNPLLESSLYGKQILRRHLLTLRFLHASALRQMCIRDRGIRGTRYSDHHHISIRLFRLRI